MKGQKPSRIGLGKNEVTEMHPLVLYPFDIVLFDEDRKD